MSTRAAPVSIARPYRRAFAANATASSFAARPDSVAEPTGDRVIDLFEGGFNPGHVASWASLIFFGTGDANDVFNAKVYGVRRLGLADGTTPSWTHVPLLSLVVTLGAKTGVAAGLVLAAELYADTLVAASPSYGVADVSYRLVSPADDSVARLLLDCEGFEKLRIDVDADTGSPTGMNALVALV